jgi:hypothetical protein
VVRSARASSFGSAPVMKVCEYCGRENEQDAAFCRECETQEFKRPIDERCPAEAKKPMTTRERWSYCCCAPVLLTAMGLNIAGHDGLGTPLAMAALSFVFGVANVNGRLTTLTGQQEGSDANHTC